MRPRRPRTQPRPLAHSLTVALRSAGLLAPLHYVEVLRAWPEAVGPGMAQQAWPEALKDGALVVATSHPAWKHELHYRQAEILTRLERLVGPGVVRSLSSVLRPRRPGPAVAPAHVPGAEARAVGEQVARGSGVADDLVRDALVRAAVASTEARFRGRLGGEG